MASSLHRSRFRAKGVSVNGSISILDPTHWSSRDEGSGFVTVTIPIFDERRREAWWLAAGSSLILSVFAVLHTTDLLSLNLAHALLAAVVGGTVWKIRMPRFSLMLWWIVLAVLWLSPLAFLSVEVTRLFTASFLIIGSMVFVGRLRFAFSGMALVAAWACATIAPRAGERWWERSVLMLVFGFGTATMLLLMRRTRDRREWFESATRESVDAVERARRRLGGLVEPTVAVKSVDANGWELTARGALAAGAESMAIFDGDVAGETPMRGVRLDETLACLRRILLDFQLSQRRGHDQSRRAASPVRFVFFPPTEAYSAHSLVSVELSDLVSGVESLLRLACESLPEPGPHKREGVVRLSVRASEYRVEIAIEDNGRGLSGAGHLPPMEAFGLPAFHNKVDEWGGRFERVVRVGVGSRSVIELPVVARPVPFRSVVSAVNPAPGLALVPADGVPLA